MNFQLFFIAQILQLYKCLLLETAKFNFKAGLVVFINLMSANNLRRACKIALELEIGQHNSQTLSSQGKGCLVLQIT